MCWQRLLPAILATAAIASAQPPVCIILVGDSTIALHTGWGAGFCADVAPQVTCVNMAKGGRSSASYRAEGSWANVIEAMQGNPGFHATYVLLQFGHNDQPGKPGRSTDLATEFPANMRRYVEDVRAAGALPVLITPLTCRQFKDGKVADTLAPWADAARKVAAAENVPLLDLHGESMAALQRMGPVEANTLAVAPPPPEVADTAASGTSVPVPPGSTGRKGTAEPRFDYTHLGDKGAAYYGRMAANQLIRAVPELKPYIKPE